MAPPKAKGTLDQYDEKFAPVFAERSLIDHVRNEGIGVTKTILKTIDSREFI